MKNKILYIGLLLFVGVSGISIGHSLYPQPVKETNQSLNKTINTSPFEQQSSPFSNFNQEQSSPIETQKPNNNLQPIPKVREKVMFNITEDTINSTRYCYADMVNSLSNEESKIKLFEFDLEMCNQHITDGLGANPKDCLKKASAVGKERKKYQKMIINACP